MSIMDSIKDWVEDAKKLLETATNSLTPQEIADRRKSTGEKQAVAATVRGKTALQQDQLKQTVAANSPSSSPEVQSTTEKKEKVSTAVSEIERIFQTEVFETAKFKETNGVVAGLLAGDKVKKAQELKKGIGEIISEAKTELWAIQNDTELQKSEKIKKVYENATKSMNENGQELADNFPGVREKVIAQIEIIKTSVYSSATEQPPAIAVLPVAPQSGGNSEDIQKKVEGFLSGTLGMSSDSWMTKGIVWFLWAIGLFKAGSWLSEIFDWISKPFDSMKKKATEMWWSPLKWAEGKWEDATNWVKGIFGMDSISLGTIATDGKTYKNDSLKISMDANDKSFVLDGTKYELSIPDGNITTLAFEKWDDKAGDYVIINGQKIPVIALKKRIEGNIEKESTIVFAENFEGNKKLILKKK